MLVGSPDLGLEGHACRPPVCQRQRRLYSSNWWYLVSYRRLVSGQVAQRGLQRHWRSYRPLGLCGEKGSGKADGEQVQWPLQGVGVGQQCVEDPGGREGGCRQQGPPEDLGREAPKAAMPPRRGRRRTDSVVSVSSTFVAVKSDGPV